MRRRGFSVLEVLMAMLILVPVAVVVVGLFPYAHTMNQRGWALGVAHHLATTEMEKVRSGDFDSATGVSYTQSERGMIFQVTTTVTPVGSGLKKVTADVTWQ
ncbi:unnamed protein product, partial [Phaeothamnion confervicola]